MAFRPLSRKWLLFAHFFSLVGTSMAATEKQSDDTGYEQQAERIADRVHVLHQGPGFHVQVIGNVTIVEQKDGVVLIDSGGTPGAGRRLRELLVQNDPWLLQWLEADWEPIAICALQEAKGISIVQGKSCRA
jgi:hypothetical protein